MVLTSYKFSCSSGFKFPISSIKTNLKEIIVIYIFPFGRHLLKIVQPLFLDLLSIPLPQLNFSIWLIRLIADFPAYLNYSNWAPYRHLNNCAQVDRESTIIIQIRISQFFFDATKPPGYLFSKFICLNLGAICWYQFSFSFLTF